MKKLSQFSFNDPSLTVYDDISQLPEHTFDEIKHFFRFINPWRARKPL